MKTELQITRTLNDLRALKLKKEQSYSRLNQIDMLSSTGNTLQEDINQIKGQISALNWVVLKSEYYETIPGRNKIP